MGVEKVEKKFFITSVKIFNTFPHNGCRHKKVKRKKFKKLFKFKSKFLNSKKKRKKKKIEEMAERFKAADCKSVDFISS